MKKTLLAVSIAGLVLAAGLNIGMAQAAAPIKIIASDMGGKGLEKAAVTVEVSAERVVTAKVVESTGNAVVDARIERLVVGSVNPSVALDKVAVGKGVRYTAVPVTIQYVAAGGCIMPMSSSVADIIDSTVICAPLASSGFRSGGGQAQE